MKTEKVSSETEKKTASVYLTKKESNIILPESIPVKDDNGIIIKTEAHEFPKKSSNDNLEKNNQIKTMPKHYRRSLLDIYKNYGIDALLQYIEENSIDINLPFSLKNNQSIFGFITIYSWEDAKKLLDSGLIDINKNLKNMAGNAVKANSAEALNYFISKGAEIPTVTNSGKGLYIIAAQNGNMEIIKMLEENGIFDDNAWKGRDAFDWAVVNPISDVSLLKHLNNKGFNIKERNFYDAARFGGGDALTFLGNITPELKSIRVMGQTMMDIAVDYGRSVDYIKKLEKKGFRLTKKHFDTAVANQEKYNENTSRQVNKTIAKQNAELISYIFESL